MNRLQRGIFNLLLIIGIGIGLLPTTRAENLDKSLKMKDLPAAVQRTVQEQSKWATRRGLAKEIKNGKTVYELSLQANGRSKDLLIDPTGRFWKSKKKLLWLRSCYW